MIATRFFYLALVIGYLLCATPVAQAVITVTGNEVWDGILNPHAAQGVTLADGVYSIPDELLISNGAAIFLQDFNGSNISDSITFDFTGTGGLTYADETGFIGTYIGARNQGGGRFFTLNMNANDIMGPGQIINDIFVLDGASGDPLNVVINSMGNVQLGLIDLRRDDAQGGDFDVNTTGSVDIDTLFVGDISGGGGSAPTVSIFGSSITLGETDTRALRNDGNANNGTVNLTALAPPDFAPNNITGNLAAENVVTLTGPINTNGAGPNGGSVNVVAAKVILESGVTSVDLSSGGTFNVQTGVAGGGFSEADLFMNNSAVTPDSVTFNIFHDNVGPPVIEWDENASGNWFGNANWDFNAAPVVNSQVALFGAAITSPQTVFLNQGVTVKGVQFDTTSTVALAGPGSLDLDADSGNASVEALQGNQQVQVAVTMAVDTTLSASSGAELNMNNTIDTGGNTLSIAGDGQVNINNTVTGGGSVNNSGVLGTAGATTIAGDLSSTGTLDIDIGGSNPLSFDAFMVAGSANIDGSVIDVALADGFSLSGSESFTVLTANALSAAGVTLGGPDGGLFNLVTSATSAILQAIVDGDVIGDYNQDGSVNAADYTVWRNNLDSNTPLPNDGGLGAPVDQRYYDQWKTNFGLSASGSVAGAAVPEPNSLALLMLAILGLSTLRRRR